MLPKAHFLVLAFREPLINKGQNKWSTFNRAPSGGFG